MCKNRTFSLYISFLKLGGGGKNIIFWANIHPFSALRIWIQEDKSGSATILIQYFNFIFINDGLNYSNQKKNFFYSDPKLRIKEKNYSFVRGVFEAKVILRTAGEGATEVATSVATARSTAPTSVVDPDVFLIQGSGPWTPIFERNMEYHKI